MDGIAVKPLTVDFHEGEFLDKLNQENKLGFWFQFSDDEKEQAGNPWGPSNPQALNRYSYVQNNPLKYIDPSGHEGLPHECKCGGGGGPEGPGGGNGSGTPSTWRNGWRAPNGKFTTPQGTARAGQAAVDEVEAAINAKPGWRIVGQEVSARDINGNLRRYDLVAESPQGRMVGIEVKSGNGALTPSQKAFDRALNSSGMDTVDAVGAYRGIQIRRAILMRME